MAVNNYASPAKKSRQSKYNKGRYRLDWVDSIHFNNNGKKACTIIVLDPKHSTNPDEVTCRVCRKYIDKNNWSLK
jgi:hypothetical protein